MGRRISRANAVPRSDNGNIWHEFRAPRLGVGLQNAEASRYGRTRDDAGKMREDFLHTTTQSTSGASSRPRNLYRPEFEHDACGVGFVVDMHGRRSLGIVEMGLTVLENLAHRGASGAEAATGDGAGILIQVPHEYLVESSDFDLPDAGQYATGIAFLPREPEDAKAAAKQIEALAFEEASGPEV